MAQCVFCGNDKKLTREHIYSDGLLRLFDSEAPLTVDNSRGIAHYNDPVIRDLCQNCNSALSSCDTAMINLARDYLASRIAPGTTIVHDQELVLRWLVKTAANVARASRWGCDFWIPLVPFLLSREKHPDRVRGYFSPWEDLSPMACASKLGAILHIQTLEALLVGFPVGSSKYIRGMLDIAVSIKIGHGVFLLLIWKSDFEPAQRDSVDQQLVEYNWRRIGDLENIRGTAFNHSSSTTVNVVGNPQTSIQKLVDAERQDSAHPAPRPDGSPAGGSPSGQA